MTTWTERHGTIWVETTRQGVLSPVGHDLRLEVTRFHVQRDDSEATVRATIESASLRLRAAIAKGEERPGAIGRGDQARIERRVATEVLQAGRHPEIVFESDQLTATPTGYLLPGTLSLLGRDRPLTLELQRSSDRLRGCVDLQMSAFGVPPVSALFGALKVNDRVQVILDLQESP